MRFFTATTCWPDSSNGTGTYAKGGAAVESPPLQKSEVLRDGGHSEFAGVFGVQKSVAKANSFAGLLRDNSQLIDRPASYGLTYVLVRMLESPPSTDRSPPTPTRPVPSSAPPRPPAPSAPTAKFGGLYPAYVRGEAYLAARRGQEAAVEFQKVLNHRGIVLADPIGALAHLQLGRAYVISGDITRAKSAYQDFLSLWKDADADLPVLKQARAEWAKL
jgi:hypothetical protein